MLIAKVSIFGRSKMPLVICPALLWGGARHIGNVSEMSFCEEVQLPKITIDVPCYVQIQKLKNSGNIGIVHVPVEIRR